MNKKLTQDCIRLIKEGYTAKAISEELHCRLGYVYNAAKRNGLVCAKKITTHTCPYCGNEFRVNQKNKNRKYCSNECTKKAVDERYNDGFVSDMVRRYLPEWEYVGDYTGSDGTMVIRHICGHTRTVAVVSARHVKIKCQLCEERKRRSAKEKQKAVEKELKLFNRPFPKYSQESMKVCATCGAFFVGRGKYCGEDCRKKARNHYDNMKKSKRRKASWTEESKDISLLKLFNRDKGICWICGEQCDIDADTNDNMYPSIDHVIPIARGGEDRWDNIRLAHRICNSIKWANVVEVHPPVSVTV